MQFSNPVTHTRGFVARDDKRREVIVAFRGSRELSDMVIGTTHCITQRRAHPALQLFLLQTAISFLFRCSPMASRTTRPRCTPASSCRTILCMVRCFASCVASSKSSRAMQWSPQARNSSPNLVCVWHLTDHGRTLVGRCNRVHRCLVRQVEFSVCGRSVVHLWCVIALEKKGSSFLCVNCRPATHG